MHFGEYELSPSLIGLSLLRTGHPKAFQRLPVRTSRRCYPSFILPMRRSLGFASASADSAPVRTRFRSGSGPQALSLAGDGNSQVHYAKGTPSPHQVAPTACRAHGFRVFFTPLSEVLFTFPSRYSFAIGLSVVFSLSGWSPIIQPGFLVPRPTQVPTGLVSGLRVRGFHLLRPRVPARSTDPELDVASVL